ncbi:MAG: multicopper oxidase domain-containing protein, partial [Roseitalea porphyridii]|uniref:multicopper oxidase domain-containing protein n=3 Tax=Roseitalea porphyridii TaxID=1852022 RepID=UPI0032ECD791
MKKLINTDQVVTSRRNVLRGTALAGAAALTGGVAQASLLQHHAPAVSAGTRRPPVIKVEAGPDAMADAAPADLSGLERVRQELVDPPFAPEHEQVASGPPKIVEIEMVTHERLMTVDEDTGASIWALTYNGSVPGPLIIVHQDDYVELTLRNPVESAMEHNIDFHASTGALGGGGLTHIYPGEETVLRWKATKPGCFTYHCAPGGAMIPYHVCHGMNGAIMVLPRDGLKDAEGNPLRYDS